MEQTVILITELVGTVAFAFSGAMVGIEKRMDVFGVWLLAITTAVGGGMLRDLLLGNVPPLCSAIPSMWRWQRLPLSWCFWWPILDGFPFETGR